MRILIVEDEVRAAAYLRQGLSEAGFSVEVAHDGVEGEHLALTQAFDLLILDVMLPGRSGWEILASVRRMSQTPVLFLTARDRVEKSRKGKGIRYEHDRLDRNRRGGCRRETPNV